MYVLIFIYVDSRFPATFAQKMFLCVRVCLIEFPWHVEGKPTDHTYVLLFLESPLCPIGLFVYFCGNSTLSQLILLYGSFEIRQCTSSIFFLFQRRKLLQILCISIKFQNHPVNFFRRACWNFRIVLKRSSSVKQTS